MVLMMAPSMQEAQVPRLVPTACVARLGVVHVHHVDVLIRIEWDTTCRTSIALGPQERLPPSGDAARRQSCPPPLVPVGLGVWIEGAGAPLDLDVADNLGVAVPGQRRRPWYHRVRVGLK